MKHKDTAMEKPWYCPYCGAGDEVWFDNLDAVPADDYLSIRHFCDACDEEWWILYQVIDVKSVKPKAKAKMLTK